MNSFDKLHDYFKKFPGIGSRQAKRFVYHLLGKNSAYANDLAKAIVGLKKEMAICPDCSRNFQKIRSPKCRTCSDTNRDSSSLLVVASDIDLDTIESSSSYHGYYFVIGGLVPILDTEPEKRIRLSGLTKAIEKMADRGLKEIILALNANPEGEYTGDFLREALAPLINKHSLKVTVLGRGFSSGTEVEYSDAETIKNALKGRA
jgi:recombination protein RecR